jgi:hypothetical protein
VVRAVKILCVGVVARVRGIQVPRVYGIVAFDTKMCCMSVKKRRRPGKLGFSVVRVEHSARWIRNDQLFSNAFGEINIEKTKFKFR